MNPKSKPSPRKDRLAPERAFIVQLEGGDDRVIAGRVENVATGQRQTFSSAEELNRFLVSELDCGKH